MTIAITHSRALVGIQSPAVTIEVHLSRGLPSLSIVGLPETSVKESKDRVRSAIINNNFEFPLRRITINLAPADLPKEGSRFDLAIAIGILAASGQIPDIDLDQFEFLGELALTGTLRQVCGVLPASSACRNQGRTLVLPEKCVEEACLIPDCNILAAKHLMDVCLHLSHCRQLDFFKQGQTLNKEYDYPDLSEVKGQALGKRALEIAAAGGHNLIMIGPPGTGKTMLAERLPGILPPMTDQQALETASITSVSTSQFDSSTWKIRPFRQPHHTASAIALVGGGSRPRPGEISLAHNGILFLDELPEFDRKVLEVLREPMESKKIHISRAAQQVNFPANFQLIAAMNPCPCGYLGDSSGRCHCTEEQVRRYRSRISGPLLDRIDLHIQIPPVPGGLLLKKDRPGNVTSSQIRERVIQASDKQSFRSGKSNHLLCRRDIEKHCRLDTKCRQFLESAHEQLGLSVRALHSILKIARTIADLAQSSTIELEHLSEAISLRCLDRQTQFMP